MELKGSQTEKNLWTAFAGEALHRVGTLCTQET